MEGILTENPGDRALRFIGNLTLSDECKGQRFVLRPWQADIVRRLFGTLREDGRRQYKRLFMLIPRKNAKTALAAAMACYGLLGTGKDGQQVLVAAASRDQASSLFKKCCDMIESSPFLSKKVSIKRTTKQIVARKGGNELIVLSSDGKQGHSYNPSMVIIDELHTQKNNELFDALTSGFGTRSEPLTILISTAGNERSGLLWEQYQHAKKVLAGEKSDPALLPVIYEADPSDDWTDPETWKKANPALGDFYFMSDMEEEFEKARAIPSYEYPFKQLHLNLWVAAGNKWMNMDKWMASGLPLLPPEELEGLPCWGGLDLSNKSDITAFVLLFGLPDGSFQVMPSFWIPRDYAEMCDRRGSTRYVEWGRQGFIELTEGEQIDYAFVEKRIVELSGRFNPDVIRFDPWNCTSTAQRLQEDHGLRVEELRQGYPSLNEPTKHVEWLVGNGPLRHGNNPVLTWMAGNAVCVHGSEDEVRISKRRSQEKVDGISALVSATSAALFATPPPAEPRIILLGRG